MEEIRVVVVGDERCGKTSLITRFISDSLPPFYKPTSFDKFLVTKEISGTLYNLTVWDTSGSPNFDTVRPLSYGEADVFIVCFKVSDPLSLYNVKSRWMPEIRKLSSAPLVLCGCMADLRSHPETLSHLSRMGRSVVSLDQALAISAQVEAVSYVETKARVSSQETFQLFSVASVAALESRRLTYHHLQSEAPRPASVNSSGSRTGGRPSSQEREREAVTVSVPSSPSKPSTPPVHSRSASQPVRGCPEPPPASDIKSQPLLSRKSSFRSSLPGPLGKPPLPHSQLARSPTDLTLSSRTPVTVEPPKSRLNTLGVPETGRHWQESLKSQTSTVSHGSTGSKISSTSSQVSHWAGPRDPSEPDTDNPQLLSNLDFTSPKAGVYRPVNSQARAAKKDKCSLM